MCGCVFLFDLRESWQPFSGWPWPRTDQLPTANVERQVMAQAAHSVALEWKHVQMFHSGACRPLCRAHLLRRALQTRHTAEHVLIHVTHLFVWALFCSSGAAKEQKQARIRMFSFVKRAVPNKTATQKLFLTIKRREGVMY